MSRVAVVWRGDEEARRAGIRSNERLRDLIKRVLHNAGRPNGNLIYTIDTAQIRWRRSGRCGSTIGTAWPRRAHSSATRWRRRRCALR